MAKAITICEVGLRDGLQNEKTILTTEQKVDLVNKMSDAGFKVIEVGSFMSPKAVPQMANTDEVFKDTLSGSISGQSLANKIAEIKARLAKK